MKPYFQDDAVTRGWAPRWKAALLHIEELGAEALAWKQRAEAAERRLDNEYVTYVEQRAEELERTLSAEVKSMAIAYHTLHERPNEPTAVMVEGFEKCAHRVCYHADKVLRKLARAKELGVE